MRPIVIGTRRIGTGEPPFIVAEAGINHIGDLTRAKELTVAAAEAGADAIKFQTFRVENMMLREALPAGSISGESFFNFLQHCELSWDDHVALKAEAERLGLIFLSTPFCREAADLLEQLGVLAFKVGSGELTNLPLQRYIAAKGKPMIISTGMSEWDEVAETVEVVRTINDQFALMQCTSSYPAAYETINLGVIPQMQERFGVPVGLSDHSLGIYTALGAVALGANLIEKHFTLDRAWPGPDQQASIEPNELAELVTGVQAIHAALGKTKAILAEERPVMARARHSVVSLRPIPAGTRLTDEMVWVKRPGTGIPAKELPQIIGQRARRDIPADTLISWDDLEPDGERPA
ncbi:N-acetylneuraminate synthase family protein [Nitrospinae bacterium AH_259_B05_G02_I21]|nr:N-acetylneuraminate synthase family protein [Nitrospinae bacterium AH_259_B05_G02_I21]